MPCHASHGEFVLQIIMFKINKCRVGRFLCPRGYQSAWADDIAVCPPYDYFENKFTLLEARVDALTLGH